MSRHDINCSPFHHKRYTPGTKIWYRKASFPKLLKLHNPCFWAFILSNVRSEHISCLKCVWIFPNKFGSKGSLGRLGCPSCVSCLCLCPLFKLTGWFKSFQSGSVATQRLRCCFQIETLVYNLHPFLAETRTSGCWKDSNRIPFVIVVFFLHLAASVALVPWSVSGLWWHSCEVKPNEFKLIRHVLLVMLRTFLRNACATSAFVLLGESWF